MIFAWDDRNREHIAKHGVTPAEAEEGIQSARSPFPRAMQDDKFMVWGQTQAGRYLQVVFVFKTPDELTYDELTREQWMRVETDPITRIVRVIHAMDLSDQKKRSLRKQRR